VLIFVLSIVGIITALVLVFVLAMLLISIGAKIGALDNLKLV
jgi:hypothetical protein